MESIEIDPKSEDNTSGCTCSSSEEAHTCPYKEEINQDFDTLCTCCAECQYQCCQDI